MWWLRYFSGGLGQPQGASGQYCQNIMRDLYIQWIFSKLVSNKPLQPQSRCMEYQFKQPVYNISNYDCHGNQTGGGSQMHIDLTIVLWGC